MNEQELNILIEDKEYLQFIEKNQFADTNKLRLKSMKDCSFDVNFAILQIDCRNRIKKKLPEIFENKQFLFPNVLSTEQCTAQEIAKFHATLLCNTDKVLDLTAGLCIDAYYISKHVNSVTALELNPNTAIVSHYNMSRFTENVIVLNQDCIDYVRNTREKFNIAFIDPARRGDNNKRLFGLSDCVPNVLDLMNDLKNITNILFIKASPMLDILHSIKELNSCVSDIWVVGVNNECKEVLFKVILSNNDVLLPIVHTVNFSNGETQYHSQQFGMLTNDNIYLCPKIGYYLYEPNSCIMKAQLFNSLVERYNVAPISANSHLFVNEQYVNNFPGRKFKILDIIPFKNNLIKNIKKTHPQINVSVRNFKITAEELKKKLKVNDGGDKYLFGTTDKESNAILIICEKACC